MKNGLQQPILVSCSRIPGDSARIGQHRICCHFDSSATHSSEYSQSGYGPSPNHSAVGFGFGRHRCAVQVLIEELRTSSGGRGSGRAADREKRLYHASVDPQAGPPRSGRNHVSPGQGRCKAAAPPRVLAFPNRGRAKGRRLHRRLIEAGLGRGSVLASIAPGLAPTAQ